MKRINPPVYFLASLVLIALLALLLPGFRLLPLPWNLIGILPLPLGLALNLNADGAFKRHGTTIKPFQESSSLVVEGAYRVTRNPMYLGLTAILLGEACLFGAAVPFAVVLAFAIAMDRRFIRHEEAMLAEKFGEAYTHYCSQVRRWL